MSLSFKEQCKLGIGIILVKLGKLRYDDYTLEELSPFIDPHLPLTIPVDIPMGNAQLTLIQGKLSLMPTSNQIGLQLLGELNVTVLENRIYRAHIVITLTAEPHYNAASKCLSVKDIILEGISLVNDDYALIKNTQFLLDKLVPSPVSTLLGAKPFSEGGLTNNPLTRGLKSALSLVSGGSTDQVSNYLSLYLKGSKQAVLDYHTPQIREIVSQHIETLPTSYTLADDGWREALFARLGKSVRVEPEGLRFYF